MISSLLIVAEGDAAQQGSPFGMFMPMIVIFVLFYFMLIRPQRRQQKEHQLRLSALKSGDEVVTNGGIHGLITNVAERTITLKIADNVKIKVERSCIATILKKVDEPESADAAKDESSAADAPIASKAVS